ncbi:dihydropteroate synthase [Microterricola pindariensis]|uniref:dihydropteroate synthase n=1 Tax=Microterricola pindariensis TaxID=478010 RepID=A0ABX5AZE8_9MICO|nr:dihydropteroate synthase [Microterricola pindariensis]PPL19910.1 dihydropteroate synthase [Microterricola pindariensis]
MGIVNVTPDSFSDGGRWAEPSAAVAHARQLVASGADIIDVGGESTRPGAPRVDPAAEQARVVPVVAALAEAGIAVSVDTMNASTALATAAAGALIINDVSGGLADPAMADAVAASGLHYVAMHWRAHADTMQQLAQYGDVVSEVCAELTARVDVMKAAGVAADKLILDPGLGFAKTAAHNWALLGRLGELRALGYPVLVGASRKRFLGELLPDGTAPAERDLATAVVSALSAQQGAWALRVHDVAGTRVALDVLASWQSGARA